MTVIASQLSLGLKLCQWALLQFLSYIAQLWELYMASSPTPPYQVFTHHQGELIPF